MAQYSAFVSKVREYEKTHTRKEAVKRAVIYCRKHDILGMFLKKYSSEVENMLFTEWNWDDAKEVWQEEAREEGIEIGREEQREEIARNALAKGFSVETVQEITGLDMLAIECLRK